MTQFCTLFVGIYALLAPHNAPLNRPCVGFILILVDLAMEKLHLLLLLLNLIKSAE